MKGLMFCHAVLLSALATTATAQSVTISVADAPFVLNGEVSQLADITITETVPNGLRDGAFALYFAENPDQRVLFQPGSTASGAATALAVRGAPGASGLVIDVDTDDGLIDSITVRAEVTIDFYDESYSFRNGPINIVLNDEPTLYGFVPPGAGVGLGTANGAYAMGVFGGSGGIGMGGAPVITMEVGETIMLPLTHGHPGHIIVESFQPAIAEVVSHTLSDMEIAALAPGEALIQAWNPIGESGYLNISVQDAALPASEQIRLLIDEVAALVPADLRAGQARSLIAKLRAALRAVEAGRTRPACANLQSFVREVEALIRAGRLDAVIGGELLAAAGAARDTIGC